MRETGVPGEKPSGEGENQQQTHLLGALGEASPFSTVPSPLYW